jgi:PAS domain S-box-containing protein
MLRILLIDDNPADRALAIRALEKEFSELEIIQVGRASEFERAIAEGNFDVTITDYQLRWSKGTTVLRLLKNQYPDRPVIMFTNSGSQEIAVEAMKLGLDDYVIKSAAHYVRLPTAICLALERAEAKQKAAGLEVRLQSLLDRLEIGVYRLSSDGILLEANRAFFRLLGLESLGNVSPSKLERYFPPDVYTELIDRLQQNGHLKKRELQIYRADGKAIWVRIAKTITETNSTKIIDGTIEDISDRKEIELENARLYRQARQANQLKDEFLATVSHELKTPLNPILGWAKILQGKELVDANTLKKALEVIVRNAKHQNQLIEDLLDISRIVSDRLRLDRQPITLQPIILSAIEDVCLSAEKKFILIQTHLDASVGQVLGDSDRLHQIVWNLLSNAIKFTPERGQIDVELTSDTSVTPAVAKLIFKDTGIGIDPAFLPHIFDRFRQADGSKTRAQGGLGLGLAIVRQLVELHDGAIVAESLGKNRGTTFAITIPLLCLCDSSQPQILQTTTPSSPLARLSNIHAVVVEDDPDNRNLIAFILEREGATVATAASALEALETICQTQPNILISDIGLPDTDGYTLLQQIRADREFASLPAIALTAFARLEDEERALAAGFTAHLAKPVNPNDLSILVAQLVDRG